MAFKKFTDYVEEKNGQFFVLANDQDSADVIFLYRSMDDVLMADVHYISSSQFNGYAHCLRDQGRCPACSYPTKNGTGIRRDSVIFIPLYNINKRRIEFWQRSTRFENILHQSVFKNYPNPSEYVFTITRNGEAGDRNTRYSIRVAARNADYPYEKILSDFNMTFPEGYSQVCKELSYAEMESYLSSDAPSNLPEYGYTPVPRGTAASNSVDASVDLPDFQTVPTPDYSADVPHFSPASDLPVPDFGDSTSTSEGGSDESNGSSGSEGGDGVIF